MRNCFNIKACITVAAFGLAGCASTEAPVTYPSLASTNLPTYVWDDSKSVALNVAKMAEPAGVGIGMRDYATAEEATNGKISGTTQAFDTVVMGLSQGIFGILSSASMTGAVNDARNWKPAIVQLIPVDEFGPLEQPNAYLKLRDRFEQQVKEALTKKYSDMEWYGARSVSEKNANNLVTFGFKSSACKELIAFHSRPESKKDYLTDPYGKYTIEKLDFGSEYCYLAFYLDVTHNISAEGKQNYVFVAESAFGQNLLPVLSESINSYFVFPNSYSIWSLDKTGAIQKGLPYAFVSKGNKIYPFVKP